MFGDYLTYHARVQPQAPAIETAQGKVGYAQFEADVVRVAARLSQWGLPAGAKVLVADSRPYTHWLLLMALERLNLISISDDNAGRAAEVVQPQALITDKAPPVGWSGLTINSTPEWLRSVLGGPVPAFTPPPRPMDAVVRIMLSSGTTGVPKQIVLTRRLILERSMLGLSFGPVWRRALVTLGINSFGGYGSGISMFMTGGTMVYGGALSTAEAIDRLKPDNLFMAPIQLQYLLAALPAGYPRQPQLGITLGGSATPRRLIEETRQRLTNRITLAYGSTEAGGTAMGAVELLEKYPGAQGVLFPWAEVEVLDENGAILPPGRIGRLRVRAPGMVHEHGNPTEGVGDGVFQDGWFYPGDLGSVLPGGILVIEGRNDDVVNVGGIKLSAFAIEEALLAADRRIAEAAVVGLPDADGVAALFAGVVCAPDTPLGQVEGQMAVQFGRPVRLVAVERIERNQMGKIVRAAMRSVIRAKLNR